MAASALAVSDSPWTNSSTATYIAPGYPKMVGIGTSNPSTTFHISNGGLLVTNNGLPILQANYVTINTSNIGINTSNSSNLSSSQNTGDAKVGILTKNPLATLDVNGTIRATGITAENVLYVTNGNVILGEGKGVIFLNNYFGYKQVKEGNNYSMSVEAYGSSSGRRFQIKDSWRNMVRFMVDYSNGRVGIGTTSPTKILDINGALRTRASPKGICDINADGTIAYEFSNSTGTFYGCRRTATGAYSWVSLH